MVRKKTGSDRYNEREREAERFWLSVFLEAMSRKLLMVFGTLTVRLCALKP